METKKGSMRYPASVAKRLQEARVMLGLQDQPAYVVLDYFLRDLLGDNPTAAATNNADTSHTNDNQHTGATPQTFTSDEEVDFSSLLDI